MSNEPLRQCVRQLAKATTLFSLVGVAVVALRIHVASAQTVTPRVVGTSAVKFLGKGPAGFKLVGTTDSLEAKVEGAAIRWLVKLDTLDTGISLRDSHMKEKYLETAKFPHATLDIDPAKVALDAGKKTTGTTEGLFGLHGKTKTVPIEFSATPAEGGFDITATFSLNLKDFEVNIPNYLGVTVKPDINVEVKTRIRLATSPAAGTPGG